LAKSRNPSEPPRYGRGTGVPNPIDVHVGSRIRQRRMLLGMNQESLARALDLTFQQVQKYEGGSNRVSASRLYEIAEILGVPMDYFFAGLEGDAADLPAAEREWNARAQQPETIELIRMYYSIQDQRSRHQFCDMIKAVARTFKRQD
jgi:transcriptional regulator with XRE-family HTH domain